MTFQNPYIHALVAELYIVLLVPVLFVGTKHVEIPETFIIPITMLSLLVLSVALMSYLFYAIPLKLILGGKREEGLRFFLKTLCTFALLSFVSLALLYATTFIGFIPSF